MKQFALAPAALFGSYAIAISCSSSSADSSITDVKSANTETNYVNADAAQLKKEIQEQQTICMKRTHIWSACKKLFCLFIFSSKEQSFNGLSTFMQGTAMDRPVVAGK